MVVRFGMLMVLLLQNISAGAPENAPGPLQMLANKSVARELELTKEQTDKVDEVSKANRELRERLWKEAGITLQNLQQKRADIDRINRMLNEAANKALAGVLKPEQSKRFAQINLQQQGLRAFATPEVQKALMLSEAQQKKIKQIIDALAMERTRLFMGLKAGDREKFQEASRKFAEKLRDALIQVATLLSAEQRKSWKEMIGEPFEMKFDG